MTMGMLSGIVTVVMLLSFLGVVAWAYSSRRSKDFTEAARLPLDDSEGPQP